MTDCDLLTPDFPLKKISTTERETTMQEKQVAFQKAVHDIRKNFHLTSVIILIGALMGLALRSTGAFFFAWSIKPGINIFTVAAAFVGIASVVEKVAGDKLKKNPTS